MIARRAVRILFASIRPPVGVMLAASLVAASAGCGSSKQKVSVSTVPAGAEVELQRRGTMDIDASIPVADISGSLDGGSF